MTIVTSILATKSARQSPNKYNRHSADGVCLRAELFLCCTRKHTSSYLSPMKTKPRAEWLTKITEWMFSSRALSFEGIICKTQGTAQFDEMALLPFYVQMFPFPWFSIPDHRKRLAAKRLFYPNSCAVKCIFQLTKFADLSRLDTLIIYNVKVFFLYLKTKVTAFNFL